MNRWLFIFSIFLTPAFSQVALVDDQTEEHIFTLNELSYFIDPADTLTISVAASPEFRSRFLLHGSYQNKDFQAGAAYWIRMPVEYHSKSKKDWIFEFYDQTIDHP